MIKPLAPTLLDYIKGVCWLYNNSKERAINYLGIKENKTMKYFIDTEFLEGTQDKTFLGFKYSKTKPTIDLISIGIVAEDGREYYAISKDFNLKEAWKIVGKVNFD